MENQQLDQKWVQKEVAKCRKSPVYFARTYCRVFDAEAKSWLPFDLWPDQVETLEAIHANKRVICLKARQLGLTWLALSYALWLMLFKPGAQIGLWSLRETEASELLSTRLLGVYQQLPEWMRTTRIAQQNSLELALENGSRALGFPANRGDSYSFSFALVDEADLIPKLDKLLGAVKPTVDQGKNKLVLLSRPDKSAPESAFKKIFQSAQRGDKFWHAVFLPWSARPDRDDAWYAGQRQDSLSRTGALDDLYEQYPASIQEALTPRSLDKRIAFEFLKGCYEEIPPVESPLSLPGLRVYRSPEEGRKYVLGCDPAEGNPNSDDSALCVMDVVSGEEVATLAAKVEPSVFGSYIEQISLLYNRAPVLVEANNHGAAVLLWLRDNSHVRLLLGLTGKPGWLTNSKSKSLMYTDVADVVRDQMVVVHDPKTFNQLCSIEASTLSAPKGQHDDAAMAFALAVVASGKVPVPSGKVATAENIPRIPPRQFFGVSGPNQQATSSVPRRCRSYRLFGLK